MNLLGRRKISNNVSSGSSTPPVYLDNGGMASVYGGSLNVPYPSTINSGDLLLLVCYAYNQSNPPSASGWSLISSNGAFSPSVSLYYKIATGSESGTTTITASGAILAGVIARFSGVNSTTPYSGNLVTGVAYSVTSYSKTITYNSSNNNSLALSIGVLYGKRTNMALTGSTWDSEFILHNPSYPYCSIGVQSEIVASSGNKPASNYSATWSPSSSYNIFELYLNAA